MTAGVVPNRYVPGAFVAFVPKQGSEPPSEPPVFAGEAWSFASLAVTHKGSVRAHMQKLALTAASRAPAMDFEPNPLTVGEAYARIDGDCWRAAAEEEMDSLREYGVWEVQALPVGKHALPCRWVFDRKRDGRYKARLVAGGHRQRFGLDYDETFAPVCGFRTLRAFLAVCAHEDLEMRQFDIKTAFLNGELDEEVYMRTPPGMPGLGPGLVLRLRRALYGLKQAGRAWSKTLEGSLRARGFTQSDSDPALWILRGPDGALLALFYVDDGLVAARTAAEADALVAMMGEMYQIRVIGEPSDFLGIRVTRDRAAYTIKIDQEDKARALAAEAGVTGAKRVLPMRPEVFKELRQAVPGEPMADAERYSSTIGSLLHLAQCTRPDIALAVNALSSYVQEPSVVHWEAALDVVRYVGHTAHLGITYGRTAAPLEMYCDANYASCLDTRRSITGYLVVMYGGAIAWGSKKQATTAASTMEAEYQGCGMAAREALAVRKLEAVLALLSSDFPIVGPLTIFCDNQAALGLLKDRKEGQRVKHIDVIHHFARDRVASGELQFVYCRSVDNISDCLTKALPRPALAVCMVGMGMLSIA